MLKALKGTIINIFWCRASIVQTYRVSVATIGHEFVYGSRKAFVNYNIVVRIIRINLKRI